MLMHEKKNTNFYSFHLVGQIKFFLVLKTIGFKRLGGGGLSICGGKGKEKLKPYSWRNLALSHQSKGNKNPKK